MMLLQLSVPDFGLAQYGLLGIFAALLIGALVFVFKLYTGQMDKRMDQLQLELNEEKSASRQLQARLDTYIGNDNKSLQQALIDSSSAIRSNSEVLKAVLSKLVSGST